MNKKDARDILIKFLKEKPELQSAFLKITLKYKWLFNFSMFLVEIKIFLFKLYNDQIQKYRYKFVYWFFRNLYILLPVLEKYTFFPSVEKYFLLFNSTYDPANFVLNNFLITKYNPKIKEYPKYLNKDHFISSKKFEKFLNPNLEVILNKYYFYKISLFELDCYIIKNYSKLGKYLFTKYHIVMIVKYCFDHNLSVNLDYLKYEFDQQTYRRIKLEKLMKQIK